MQLKTFPGVFSAAEQLLYVQPRRYKETQMSSEVLA